MATPGMVASVEWTDGKRYLWMLGALTITLPIVAAVSALATGWQPQISIDEGLRHALSDQDA